MILITGDMPVTYADTSAPERGVGFRAQMPLREGLRRFGTARIVHAQAGFRCISRLRLRQTRAERAIRSCDTEVNVARWRTGFGSQAPSYVLTAFKMTCMLRWRRAADLPFEDRGGRCAER